MSETDDPRNWSVAQWAAAGLLAVLLSVMWGIEPEERGKERVGEWLSPGHQITAGAAFIQFASFVYFVSYPSTVGTFVYVFFAAPLDVLATGIVAGLDAVVPDVTFEMWHVSAVIAAVPGGGMIGSGLVRCYA